MARVEPAGGGSSVTEPANRVRAVARVGGGTAQAAPAALRPYRRAGQLGPLHILQILVIEAVVVAAVALTGQGPVVAAGAGAVALLLTLATVARRHGRWWLDQWALTRRYRDRARAGSAGDDQLADLWRLAPGLSVTDVGGAPVADSAQTTLIPPGGRAVSAEPAGAAPTTVVGVARDDAGWYAVAELQRAAAMADQPTAAVPLPMLVRALAGTGQAGVLLQVVTQGVPAPAATVHPSAPAARSYQELQSGVGSGNAPVERDCWVTVRLDARLLAASGAADDAAQRAPLVVAALLRRVVRTLHRAGLPARALDRTALLATLRHTCALGEGREAPREEWGGWHGGQLSYVSYWIDHWPGPTQVPGLLQALTAVPAAQTSLATIVAVPAAEPDAPEAELGDTEVRCLLRVGAPAEQLGSLHDAVWHRAREHGGGLQRLDGEHGPAVYATAPTGGGPW